MATVVCMKNFNLSTNTCKMCRGYSVAVGIFHTNYRQSALDRSNHKKVFDVGPSLVPISPSNSQQRLDNWLGNTGGHPGLLPTFILLVTDLIFFKDIVCLSSSTSVTKRKKFPF